MIKNLAKLIDVKSIVTLILTAVFAILSINGKISAEQFREKLSELIGKEVTYEECKFAWLGYRQDVPLRNLDILRKLKVQGYKLILLSNTNPFMMSWGLSGEFDGNGNSLESYFDSLYLSYKLGVMKPNKKIFQYIIDNEKIQPG